MPGISCCSGPVPVAIEAAHTGVTDGKAATQSSTCWPSSSSSLRIGARPPATARSSIAGFMASMTTRMSFLLTARIRSPAYFSPARRRPPASSQASPAMTRIASGGKSTEAPAAASAEPSP